jgi:phytanoyl-CoA hydroxylase
MKEFSMSLILAHLSPWLQRDDEMVSIKLLQSMYFFRPISAGLLSLHQDEFYIPTRDRSLTAMWVPLVDVDEANGCLWVVPGSHRSGHLYALNKADKERGIHATCGEFPDAIPVKMSAGDALFFNGYLVHGPKQTYSESLTSERPVYTTHYMSGEAFSPQTEGNGTGDNREIHYIFGEDPYVTEKGPTTGPKNKCIVGLA